MLRSWDPAAVALSGDTIQCTKRTNFVSYMYRCCLAACATDGDSFVSVSSHRECRDLHCVKARRNHAQTLVHSSVGLWRCVTADI